MRNSLACLVLCFSMGAVQLAAQGKPLTPTREILLPGVQGRIDHLAIDVQGQRLFVAALGNGSLEVIDLAKGERIRSLGGLSEPQGIVFVPKLNRIFVASGGDGTVKVFDAANFQLISTAHFSGDADNLRYDPAGDKVYVGYGEGALGALDAANGSKLGEVTLPGHPESFQLETHGSRIFVNVPTARLIAVVDRVKMQVVARWKVTTAQSNFPMALDEADHRLFIGCRHPAVLLVLDTETGSRVATLPIVGDTDDLFYDAKFKRIYVSGGEGFVDVFDQQDRDHYRRSTRFGTASGARTSLYLPQLGWFCLAVPHRGAQPAEIRVFRAEH